MSQSGSGSARALSSWLTLGQASRVLGVSESTLRRWADAGTVRSFRTPGGHRRFAAMELSRLTEGGVGGDGFRIDGEALRHIRARLDEGRAPAWLGRLTDQTRRALGDLGRHTVELVSRAAEAEPDEGALTAEASRVGADYGRLLGEAGLGLSEAVAAFSYFRTGVAEVVTRHAQTQGMAAGAAGGVWERVSRLEDEILVALTAAYEREAARTSVPGLGRHG